VGSKGPSPSRFLSTRLALAADRRRSPRSPPPRPGSRVKRLSRSAMT
jgi:hypothetical protein